MEIGWGGGVTYVVTLPKVLKMARCLVIGCPAVAHCAGCLRGNFIYIHFLSRVAVLQEGKE